MKQIYRKAMKSKTRIQNKQVPKKKYNNYNRRMVSDCAT